MARYAIVESGGHQYWVEENSVIEVERPATLGEAKELKLNQVLFLGDSGAAKIGQPYLAHTSVICEVLGEIRQPKVMSFKFKRRQGYRRRKGHRQTLTRLRVKSIETGEAE